MTSPEAMAAGEAESEQHHTSDAMHLFIETQPTGAVTRRRHSGQAPAFEGSFATAITATLRIGAAMARSGF